MATATRSRVSVGEFSDLAFLARLYEYSQKNRVATASHLENLKARGREDPFLEGIMSQYASIEDMLEKRIARQVEAHPVWTAWACRVKGCGALTLGRMMARCIRYYPGLDKLREDEQQPCSARIGDGQRCGRTDAHYHGIEQFETASQLRAHAGQAPGQRLKKDEKVWWDPRLKVACWLMAQNLRRGKGKFYDFYIQKKEMIRAEWEAREGRAIGPKKEKGELGDLDIDLRAMKKMVQVFLVVLWVVWREAEGYSVRPSYAQEKLGHTDTQPEDWVE